MGYLIQPNHLQIHLFSKTKRQCPHRFVFAHLLHCPEGCSSLIVSYLRRNWKRHLKLMLFQDIFHQRKKRSIEALFAYFAGLCSTEFSQKKLRPGAGEKNKRPGIMLYAFAGELILFLLSIIFFFITLISNLKYV